MRHSISTNRCLTQPRLSQLLADLHRLETSDHRRRLGLVAGFPTGSESPEEYWTRVESYFPTNMSSDIRNEVLHAAASELVIEGSCQAALMFGTLSPSVTPRDAMLLAERLVSLSTGVDADTALAPLVRPEPVRALDGPPWRQGYELAQELWESLGEPTKDGTWVDIEMIYRQVGHRH